MKPLSIFLLSLAAGMTSAHAMTRIEPPGGTHATTTAPVQQGGKVDAIHAAASKIVIKTETYAYNPLTTVVTINGRRGTISDVRVGDNAQFQATSQGANQPPMLTSITIQRP